MDRMMKNIKTVDGVLKKVAMLSFCGFFFSGSMLSLTKIPELNYFWITPTLGLLILCLVAVTTMAIRNRDND